jgi:hypothetical protein
MNVFISFTLWFRTLVWLPQKLQMTAEYNIKFVNGFHREMQITCLSSELCLPMASFFLNKMTAQFCGNQTAYLWNFKMNFRSKWRLLIENYWCIAYVYLKRTGKDVVSWDCVEIWPALQCKDYLLVLANNGETSFGRPASRLPRKIKEQDIGRRDIPAPAVRSAAQLCAPAHVVTCVRLDPDIQHVVREPDLCHAVECRSKWSNRHIAMVPLIKAFVSSEWCYTNYQS